MSEKQKKSLEDKIIKEDDSNPEDSEEEQNFLLKLYSNQEFLKIKEIIENNMLELTK